MYITLTANPFEYVRTAVRRTVSDYSLTFPVSVPVLGSRVVSVLDSGAEGPGFKSQPRRCRVTVLGKLFTPVPVHTRASVHQAAKLVAALFRVARVTAGLAESNDSLPPGLWLTSPAGWLPRTGMDQLRNHTLGNLVRATFTFLAANCER